MKLLVFTKIMSIKIIPEKLAKINQHKTRKKIKNTTYANKQLISRAAYLSNSLEIANKQLQNIDIPYLKDCKIVFYSPEKIILSSNKEILKSKIKQLHFQFIKILNKQTFFSRLETIEIQIDYAQQKTTNTRRSNNVDTSTKSHLNKLKQKFS